jgi:hypothetical protein
MYNEAAVSSLDGKAVSSNSARQVVMRSSSYVNEEVRCEKELAYLSVLVFWKLLCLAGDDEGVRGGLRGDRRGKKRVE